MPSDSITHAILFDFGGTIDTDGVHWSEKFWEMYKRFRISLDKKEYAQAFVQSEADLLTDKELPRATFRRTLQKQLTLQFRILKLDSRTGISGQMADACYEDVRRTIGAAREILVRLHARARLGVVSNFYGNLDVVCREFGLDTLFDARIDSSVVGIRKPDPEIFNLALRNLGVDPTVSFVVGDSYERDIVPAKELGCKTIWLKGKSWTMPRSTEAADYTVTKFSEIEPIVQSPTIF